MVLEMGNWGTPLIGVTVPYKTGIGPTLYLHICRTMGVRDCCGESSNVGFHAFLHITSNNGCSSAPPKTDMEPKNWWFVDVSPFFQGGIFRFHVSLLEGTGSKIRH